MTHDAVLTPAAETRAERFRRTEAALWEHHGLRPTERFIQLENPRIRLRVLEVGTGTPVLMVHGTVGPGSWASLIEAMGPGHRYVVLDRPGWGGSEPLDFTASPYRRVAADILRGVLDALGIDRTVVIGGSIGDVWALSLAQLDPSRVEKVVLLGGGPMVAEARRPSFIRLLASPIGALIVRLPVNADRTRSILRDSGHGPSLDDGRIPDVFVDWRVSLSNDTKSMRHERAMVRSIVRGSGWQPGFLFDDADLAAIESPALMVHGTADPVGDVDIWRRFVRVMPDADLRVIDGAGHMPWFDEPQRVAGFVNRFVAVPG
ncbi:MAG TPA: alpha/beta hydrolase [Candidatus Limnocylindrales bacterium]|nr:alpha/beta hydrolase [Candidatus Limnocylindrales bacterium]